MQNDNEEVAQRRRPWQDKHVERSNELGKYNCQVTIINHKPVIQYNQAEDQQYFQQQVEL